LIKPYLNLKFIEKRRGTMSNIYYRLTLISVNSVFLFLLLSVFSSVASAHPSSPSVLHTIFGENISHWLIAHQGLLLIIALAVLVLLISKFSAKKNQVAVKMDSKR
jgi:hypothetical protein